MRNKFEITAAFQYSYSTLLMCFERSTAGALKDAAMNLSVSHTRPDVGTDNFYFCATVILIPAKSP